MTPGRRVTFVSDSDAWGGAEVYLTHLLARASGLGWTASLVCAEPVAPRFAEAVSPERLTVVPLARHAADAPATGAAVVASAPDVVVVNLVDPASNAAALAAGLALVMRDVLDDAVLDTLYAPFDALIPVETL